MVLHYNFFHIKTNFYALHDSELKGASKSDYTSRLQVSSSNTS